MYVIFREVIKMAKCIYFEDEECESSVINTNQCNKCLVIRNTKTLIELEKRMDALEKPVPKKTGRAPKAKMVG